MDKKRVILKHALQNAVKYKGKADIKAVASKLFSELKIKDKKDLFKDVKTIVSKVNKMSLEKQTEELKKIEPKFLVKKKVKKKVTLPKLPKVKDKVVMRFAPNPNGAMSLGHARTALLNWFYTEKHNGEFILRFDDTDPKIKVPIKEAYKWFEEDLKWLGVKIDKIIRQSERLDTYYVYAKKLIDMGKAYVCICNVEDKRKLLSKLLPCECRDLDVDEQSERWDKMFNSYKEGEAVLRIKTDLKDKNPAVRDWPAMRIVEKSKHPFAKAKVWPLLNFASAIDDFEFGVTHIIRGVDLKVSDDRQKYIYDYFNWKYPEVLLNGKLLMFGVKSTSETRKLIENNELSGWDDTRLMTIKSLRRRGFKSEVIKKFIFDLGLNKRDINVDINSLIAYNKDIVDKEANRYFFVYNPKKIKIENAPKLSVSLELHPDFKRGYRKFKADDEFYVSDVIEKDKKYRLIGLFNFKDGKFLSKEKNDAKLIHWVPAKDNLKAEVVMEDNSVVNGLVEKNIKNVEIGEIVHFYRFGFCRLDSKNDVLRFYYCHG